MLQRLKNICSLLLRKKASREKIYEEQVQIFLEGLVDLFDDEDMRADAPEYEEMAVMVDEMWHYRDVRAFSPEEAFLYGAIWGSSHLEHLMRKRNGDKISMNQMIQEFQSAKQEEAYVHLLEVIERNPGIKHKNLAEKLGASPSELSQTVSKLEKEKLFSAQRSGREKYYFLRERGKEVLKRLRPEDEEEELSGDIISINKSNHDDLFSIMSKLRHSFLKPKAGLAWQVGAERDNIFLPLDVVDVVIDSDPKYFNHINLLQANIMIWENSYQQLSPFWGYSKQLRDNKWYGRQEGYS